MNIARRRLPGEQAFLLLLLLASAFLLWQSYRISGFSSITSAGVYPMLVSATMVLCIVVTLVQSRRAEAEAAAPGESAARHFLRRLLPLELVAFTAAIVLYMLALEWLGFVVASYLFLLASMRLLGSTRWGLNALVSALSLAGIYVVFQTIFAVVLPTGSLWQGVFK
jgi:putative tricarboxylic transport membrane protein